MLRLHLTAKPITMAANGINHVLTHACCPQKLRCLDAVFLRVKFEINIMKKTYYVCFILIKLRYETGYIPCRNSDIFRMFYPWPRFISPAIDNSINASSTVGTKNGGWKWQRRYYQRIENRLCVLLFW